MNIREHEEYWIKNSKLKWETAVSLFKNKKYVDSLFFFHLSIESILKAIVVKKKSQPAPFIHDLLRLSKMADINLNKEQEEILNELTLFNIAGRYPDYKFKLYKKINKKYTENLIKKIKKVKICLKKEITK